MAVTFTFAYLLCYALLHKQLLHGEAIMYIRTSLAASLQCIALVHSFNIRTEPTTTVL